MAVTARYTEQVVAMVTPDTRAYLDNQAETRGISLAEVVREMLEESRERRKPARYRKEEARDGSESQNA